MFFPEPCIVWAVLEIVQVTLMCVSLSLEADVSVGIAPHWQAYEPFDQIDEIERDYRGFEHLHCVNTLVIDKFIRQVYSWVNKQHSQQVDSRESSEWNIFGPNDFHSCL